MKKVIYACSGSEAVEIAIKLIRKVNRILGYSNKNIILSFRQSYHGTYYGSNSISGLEQGLLSDYKPLLPNVEFITPVCKCNCSEEECFICLSELEKMISKYSEHAAGIFIEPVLASAGILVPCKKYLNYLVKICRQNNILVVFDEVATGFYRTGVCFYYKKIGVEPDILFIAK